MRRAIAAVGIATVISIFAPPAHAARWVIPPGQEALAMRMLGGDPAGCRFLGASIEKTEIVARYACEGAETRLSLRHPEDAPNARARSTQLAIVVPAGASPPDTLVSAISARLRAEEASWRWIVEGRSLGRSLAAAGLSARARSLVIPLGMIAAVGFAALVAIAVKLARRARFSKAPEIANGARARVIATGLALFAAVLVYLEIAYPAAPVHADTTRDLLMAADCLRERACDHGPPTTLGVIVQGALWTRFLALFRSLGASVSTTQAMVYALHALAATVLWLASRRRFGDTVALVAAGLFAVGSAVVLDVPILWNPSIAPLPLAVFHALSFTLADDDDKGLRSTLSAAGAAFALALAMDAHVLFVVLVPPLFASIVALAKRPWTAALVATIVLVTTLVVDSKTAWSVNARALVESRAALPLAALFAAALAMGAWARPRLRDIDARARALVFLGAATVSATGMTTLLFAALGPAAGRRYAIPAVFGLALATAAILARVARRTSRPAAIAGAAFFGACALLHVLAPKPGGEGGFAIREMEIAAKEVYEHAAHHRDVEARFHARSNEEIAALAVFEPDKSRGYAVPDEEWLFVKRPRMGASATATVIDLGRSVAVLARINPRLDRSKTTFCFAPRHGVSADQGCVDARFDDRGSGPRTPEERAYPALAVVRDAFPSEMLSRFSGGVKQTIRIAVRAGEGTTLAALMDARSGYRIEGSADGTRLVLALESGELVLSREDSGEPKADRYWPPPLWEATMNDAWLVKLVEDAQRE